ncbi:MAG: PDZ domain-containing protein [Anaerolineae bacterium]|nr:PDZ domain-containing protein [Anaerolineae bacterium]
MLYRLLFFLAVTFAVIAAACQSQAVVTKVIEVTAQVTTEITVVAQLVITATPAPSATHTLTPIPPSETPTPEPTPTKTLSPIRATTEALNALVVVPTASAPAIAPDDWSGIVRQACTIVEENYVRDDFNGVNWEAICNRYIARAATFTDQQMLWIHLRNLIAELGDDHSRFVSIAGMANEFNLPTNDSGRPWPGMVINPAREDEQIFIWHVCRTGPAASAGLRRGDVILAIDGRTFTRGGNGFDQQEIAQAMYGDDKSSATFTVLRGPNSQPQDITLSYGGASGCDGWVYGLISDDPPIGYIRIPNFGGATDTFVLELLKEMETDEPLAGLILDVRHNPGGNADRTLSIFTEGTFGTLGPLRADATRTTYRIPGPVKWDTTALIVVLTDGGSHSAAEYFAIVMQLSGRALIVGYNTAGNTEGIVSFNLADGSIIRLAVQILVLPDGSLIEDVGVTPDILVPLGEWGLRELPDVQLMAAYEALLGQIEGE